MQNTAMTSKSPVNSFVLKIVAIVAMTCNHIATIFSSVLPFWVYTLMMGVGGLTFPVMAYLMLIGYHHTRNVWKYLGRLLIFAVVAQISYMFIWTRPNVLFTLAVGLFLYWLYDTTPSKFLFWFAAILISLLTVSFDWGLFGPLCMALLKSLEKYDRWWTVVIPLAAIGTVHMLFGYGVAITGTSEGLVEIGHGAYAIWHFISGQGIIPIVNTGGLATMLYGCMNIVASCVLIAYNGERGLPLKYFFYVYYPLHFAVLVGIAYAMGIR